MILTYFFNYNFFYNISITQFLSKSLFINSLSPLNKQSTSEYPSFCFDMSNSSVLLDDVRSLGISPAKHTIYANRDLRYSDQDPTGYPKLRENRDGTVSFGTPFRLPDVYRREIDRRHREVPEQEPVQEETRHPARKLYSSRSSGKVAAAILPIIATALAATPIIISQNQNPRNKRIVVSARAEQNGRPINYNLILEGPEEVPQGETPTYTMRLETDGLIHYVFSAAAISPDKNGNFGEVRSFKTYPNSSGRKPMDWRAPHFLDPMKGDPRYKAAEEGLQKVRDELAKLADEGGKLLRKVGADPDMLLADNRFVAKASEYRPLVFWDKKAKCIQIFNSAYSDGSEIIGWSAVEHELPIEVLDNLNFTVFAYPSPEPVQVDYKKLAASMKIKAKKKEEPPQKTTRTISASTEKEIEKPSGDTHLLKTYTGKVGGDREPVVLEIYSDHAELTLSNNGSRIVYTDDGPNGHFDRMTINVTGKPVESRDFSQWERKGGELSRRAEIFSQVASNQLSIEAFGKPLFAILAEVLDSPDGKAINRTELADKESPRNREPKKDNDKILETFEVKLSGYDVTNVKITLFPNRSVLEYDDTDGRKTRVTDYGPDKVFDEGSQTDGTGNTIERNLAEERRTGKKPDGRESDAGKLSNESNNVIVHALTNAIIDRNKARFRGVIAASGYARKFNEAFRGIGFEMEETAPSDRPADADIEDLKIFGLYKSEVIAMLDQKRREGVRSQPGFQFPGNFGGLDSIPDRFGR